MNRISVYFILIFLFAGMILTGCRDKKDLPSETDIKAIHNAANQGDLDKIKYMITQRPELVNAKDQSGYTPLHRPAGLGNKEIVNFLISSGADVNARDNRGHTALHFAANKEIAELLISNRAEVNIVNNKGQTPLHLAAASNRKELVEFLIQSGADVNAKNNEGHTPLYQAINTYYNDEMAALLREHGGIE